MMARMTFFMSAGRLVYYGRQLFGRSFDVGSSPSRVLGRFVAIVLA
jgi:hypothetical protein